MALGAVVNAAWDLRARIEGKPLWRLLSELRPQQVVDLIDFRYIRDVLPEAEALSLLQEREEGKAERMANLTRHGLPAYTTTPGWLGYTEEKMVQLCNDAKTEGFDFVKLKVGADHDQDMRRCALARETLGDDIRLAIDANQVWDVDEAIRRLRDFSKFDLVWVEEPTSPDDVLGHAKIRAEGGVPVATGEHVQNRIIFKQLMSAKALDFVQIDATRVGGVNENIAIMLLAAKARLPICPHAGGVGLCEMVQHLSMFDYVALGGDLEARVIEHVGHLHEHFADPVRINGGRYAPPERPGFSTEILAETLATHQFPHGSIWNQ
jgi:L-fuconate dehydratase